MEWKLYDNSSQFLQEVNCQYDSLDIAVMLYGAKKVEVDFDNKIAKILMRECTLTIDELKRRLLNVKRATGRGNNAPHKPLLILYSLLKFQNEHKSELYYNDIENEFKEILCKFTTSKRVQPEMPFIYLQKDGIWELNIVLEPQKAKRKDLNELVGGFTEEIKMTLSNNPEWVQELINDLITCYFPDEPLEEVLSKIANT